jgi:hypothetical protein
MSELTEFHKAPLPGAGANTVTTPAKAVEATFSQSLDNTVQGFERTTTSVLVLPFDIARELYSKAVQVGVLQNSMLASRDFSQALSALEKSTLGPWARRV